MAGCQTWSRWHRGRVPTRIGTSSLQVAALSSRSFMTNPSTRTARALIRTERREYRPGPLSEANRSRSAQRQCLTTVSLEASAEDLRHVGFHPTWKQTGILREVGAR